MTKSTSRASGWSHQKTEQELQDALKRQVSHLCRSAQLFDEGSLEEAERLAASIYILVHDGWKKTKSLLGQLKLLDKIFFIDSSTPVNPSAFYQSNSMCSMGCSELGWEFFPKLDSDDGPTRLLVKFGKWWNQEIYSTAAGLRFTRKNLVFALRMQDGGGHVDERVTDKAYHWLATKGDDNLNVFHPTGNQTIRNGHWATMRQIAWEVDNTLLLNGI